MTGRDPRLWLAFGWLLVAAPLFALTHPAQAQASSAQADRFPTRISDADFWSMVDNTGISEPGGYFRITDTRSGQTRSIEPHPWMVGSQGQNMGQARYRLQEAHHIHGVQLVLVAVEVVKIAP